MLPNRHSWLEAAAFFYLTAPLILFFSMYVSLFIAVPACIFIIQSYWTVAKNADRGSIRCNWKNYASGIFIATAWSIASGGFGLLSQSSDWMKHYAVLNFISDGKLSLRLTGSEDSLRYTLSWYLPPAIFAKIAGHSLLVYASSIWNLIGVVLAFLLMMPDQSKTWRVAIVPAIFAVFSGSDMLGTLVTNFQMGPAGHIEWWNGWIQYSSNTTGLSWVHQHAIPAWIAAALFLRQSDRPTIIQHIPLLLGAILLWSPFVAVGLMPHALYLSLRNNPVRSLLRWRSWTSAGLIVVPLVVYLTASADSIPAGFAWAASCPAGAQVPCFSMGSYFFFVLIEFGLFVALLYSWGITRSPMMIISFAVLASAPFISIGVMNDFAMRASMPSLAVIAILTGKLISEAPTRFKIAGIILIVVGLPTSFMEIRRGIITEKADFSTYTFDQFLREGPQWRSQYFGKTPPWLTR